MHDISIYIDLMKIRELLINKPDLLSLFEIVIIFINNSLNE